MTSVAPRGRGKIRAPRRGLGVGGFDMETNWGVLEKAFHEIHTKNASILSFEELYRNAYNIVLRQKGEDLYNRVVRYEETWLNSRVRSSIVRQLTPALLVGGSGASALATSAEKRVAGEGFLRALKTAWNDHQVCMGMLTDVLMYMDRVYCTDYHKPSIYAKSMGVFRDQILRSPTRTEIDVLTILTQIILDQIQMDRDGERIDPHLIKANVYMLEGLYETEQEAEDEKLYLTSFEEKFLDSSRVFYRDEGARLLKDSDAGAYCRHAKRRFEEESDRCRSTLSETTTLKIQTVVEDALIRHQIKSLIEMDSGVQYMVENEQMQQLNDIYELEARVDSMKPELTKAIQKIITEMAANVNNAAKQVAEAPPAPEEAAEGDDKSKPAIKGSSLQTVSALKWVEDILALKDRFDTIWTSAFHSDQTLQMALNRSLGEAINAYPRCSEYISLFIDENMKKGIRNKTEAEIDATLDKAITLVRFLQDKDIFEVYYKKHLCKRLLLNKSQSIDVEKQMIGRMKIELGNNFTGKLEVMFKDMTLSAEYTEGYRTFIRGLGHEDNKRTDLNVHILTSMTWPLEAFRHGAPVDDQGNIVQPKLNFPGALARMQQSFKQYYDQKHSGRRLVWQTHMGDVDIKATFPRGGKDGKSRTYDINCSTYSMLVLLLFNDLAPDRSLTTEEIQAQTGIPMINLTRNLQSLAVAPKTRLLVKEPMSRDVKPSDRFSFNENFKSNYVKVKVNVVAAGNKAETASERKETEEKNEDDRKFTIEAAIVRIMKQRKSLTHTGLLSETISQLSSRFKPDVNMIKKRIESLIEREYLEREEDAKVPSYKYLA